MHDCKSGGMNTLASVALLNHKYVLIPKNPQSQYLTCSSQSLPNSDITTCLNSSMTLICASSGPMLALYVPPYIGALVG